MREASAYYTCKHFGNMTLAGQRNTVLRRFPGRAMCCMSPTSALLKAVCFSYCVGSFSVRASRLDRALKVQPPGNTQYQVISGSERGGGHAGLALVAGDEAGHPDLAPGGIVERPRVLYHAASRRFVMWLHIDDEKVVVVRMQQQYGQSPVCCMGSVISCVRDMASSGICGLPLDAPIR